MIARAGLVVSSAALAAFAPIARAYADGPDAAPPSTERPTVRRFAHGVVDRARRAVSFGPMVGAGLSYAWRPGTLEVPISFGVGAVLFAIPVAPSPQEIEEMIVSRSKARLGERLKAMVTRGLPPPDGDELVRIEAEVLAEVKAEVLGQRPYAGRTLERPRLALALEGAYLPRADGWQVRVTAGVGISKLTLGPSITGSFAGGKGLYLGGEAAAHLTPWPAARSHVVDLYLRVDLGVAGTTANQVAAGARFLLDLL